MKRGAMVICALILGLTVNTQTGRAKPNHYGALDEVPVRSGQLRLVKPEKGSALGLPLKRTRVRMSIAGCIAQVEVEQTFANTFAKPIEAIYVFPLADRAAVNGYAIVIGDRVVRGVVKEAKEAKKLYNDARARGKTAALLEQRRENVFQQRVANIPPGEEIRVRIRYVEQLEQDEGRREIVFPMVVGPRYTPPGTKEAVPIYATAHNRRGAIRPGVGVSYLQPTERPGHEVELEVDLQAAVPILSLQTPSHRTTVKRPSQTRAMVRLAPNDRIPNKDFILRYQTAGKRNLVGLLVHRVQGDGYFSITVQPKAGISASELLRREVIIVIDTSGSMSGAPLAKAKEVAKGILKTLRRNERFNIIQYASSFTAFRKGSVVASPANVRTGLGYVSALSAGGGTNMLSGLTASLRQSLDPDERRFIYFITDGFVGNDTQVLQAAATYLGSARIFSIGIGSAPNRALLNQMAEIGRGFPSYLRNDEGSKDVIRTLDERTSKPYLAEIELRWEGVTPVAIEPATVPDLYAGQPLVITGRYDEPARGFLTVAGNLAGSGVKTRIPVEFPESESANEALKFLWAKKRVLRLMLESAGRGVARAEVTALGLEYQMVTPYTSFIAIDEKQVVRPNGQVITVEQPVPLPEGVQWEGVFGRDGSAAYVPAPSSPVSAPSPHRHRSRSFGWRRTGGGDLDGVVMALVVVLLVGGLLKRKGQRP